MAKARMERVRPIRQPEGKRALADAEMAGIVLCARVPIMLTSRADNTIARLGSAAIALILAREPPRAAAADEVVSATRIAPAPIGATPSQFCRESPPKFDNDKNSY